MQESLFRAQGTVAVGLNLQEVRPPERKLWGGAGVICLYLYIKYLKLLQPAFALPYLITTLSVPERPKVSGAYISSALDGGTTNSPGVVARAK